jgi:hypothetical protein
MKTGEKPNGFSLHLMIWRFQYNLGLTVAQVVETSRRIRNRLHVHHQVIWTTGRACQSKKVLLRAWRQMRRRFTDICRAAPVVVIGQQQWTNVEFWVHVTAASRILFLSQIELDNILPCSRDFSSSVKSYQAFCEWLYRGLQFITTVPYVPEIGLHYTVVV